MTTTEIILTVFLVLMAVMIIIETVIDTLVIEKEIKRILKRMDERRKMNPNTNYGQDCSIIDMMCPYDYEECEDCELYQAVEEAKRISEMKANGTYEDYLHEEYHAYDYKRNLEDDLMGE